MPRKQIVQFDAAASVASTDRFLLQQGVAGTEFTHGTVTQLLNGGLAATFASVTLNGTTVPANGMYLPAANTLGFAANTTAEMQMTGTALSPATSDGLALGTTALMWSDMFLASGGVINFNNGNVTITHTAGVLTTNADVVISGNLTQSRGVAISAAGSNQATATLLTDDISVVGTITAGQGVVLSDQDATVLNRGTVALAVYPPSGAQFDNYGTNAAVTLVADTGSASFLRSSSVLFRVR